VVFQCDEVGTLKALSNQWESLVGVSPELAIGTPFANYVREDYVPSIRLMIEQRLGRMDQVPMRHVSGDERWATVARCNHSRMAASSAS